MKLKLKKFLNTRHRNPSQITNTGGANSENLCVPFIRNGPSPYPEASSNSVFPMLRNLVASVERVHGDGKHV